jgi:hypothetical protein
MVVVDDIITNKCSIKSIKVVDRRWHVYQHVVNFLWSKISRNDTNTRIHAISWVLRQMTPCPLRPQEQERFTIRTCPMQ